MLTLLHPPTLDSFYLDTIHDTEDSTFWMTDPQTLGQLEVSMPDKKLCGPNGVQLDLRGRLTVTLSQK